jgi:hypothetical protein
MRTATLSRAAWIPLLLLGSCGGAKAPSGVAAPGPVARLAQLPRGERAAMTASVDPTGFNDDGFSGLQFPYAEEGNLVLFDEMGPGELLRIHKAFWSTVTGGEPEHYPLSFFVDDAPSPAIVIDVQDIFLGAPPFRAALCNSGVGGYCAYTSIPFTQRLKIVAPDVRDALGLRVPSQFCEFTFRRGAARSDDAAWERLAANAGAWPHDDIESWTSAPPAGPIPPSGASVVLSLAGAGTLLGLRFWVQSPADWRDLWVEMYWDGEAVPSVRVPLGMLVGASDPVYPLQTCLFGMNGVDHGWCYFAMPFRSSATLTLRNTSAQARSASVAFALATRSMPEPFGTFHARYGEALPTAIGADYEVLRVEGWGAYVGTVLEAESRASWLSTYTATQLLTYLEGDERVYVDGSRSPIHGSAGEVYFNWGWYDIAAADQPFSRPFHGYSGAVVESLPGDVALKRSLHRVHAIDPIPFYRELAFMMEHGGVNDAVVNYRSAAFYYLGPAATLDHVDEVDVGDAASEMAHGYTSQGGATLALTSRYWTDAATPSVTDHGREIPPGGVSRFVATVPDANDGLLLRARVDQEEGPGGAEVRVDGALVGVWYRSSSSPGTAPAPFDPHRRWLDMEFEIPASRVAGRGSVEIEIRPFGPAAWREFRYDVFAYRRS